MKRRKDNLQKSPASQSRPAANPPRDDQTRFEHRPDEMPRGSWRPGRRGASLAELRLHVEQLLQAREAPPREAWEALGPQAVALLERMLNDGLLREAVRQRVMATLGQIGAPSSISLLGAILVNPANSALDRTYAASALGRMQDARVLPHLARGIADEDAMVRLQVARALGRLPLAEAELYLDALRRDGVHEVARAAADALRGQVGKRRAARAPRRKTAVPRRESDAE